MLDPLPPSLSHAHPQLAQSAALGKMLSALFISWFKLVRSIHRYISNLPGKLREVVHSVATAIVDLAAPGDALYIPEPDDDLELLLFSAILLAALIFVGGFTLGRWSSKMAGTEDAPARQPGNAVTTSPGRRMSTPPNKLPSQLPSGDSLSPLPGPSPRASRLDFPVPLILSPRAAPEARGRDQPHA